MKKYIIITIAILPLLSFGQANKFLRQGKKAIDPKEKIELFTQAIELDPKNLDAYFYRGIARDNVGDFYGAIMDYTKVVFFEPSADSYFNRGNSKYSLMDFIGAKDDYTKALELDPEFTDALYSLACTKYNIEDYEGAILDLNKLPQTSKNYTQRALTYSALKNYKAALIDFSAAILINPNADTYYNRGVFFMDVNYYKKANTDFLISIEFDKNNASAYFYRGASYLLLGEYSNALSDFSMTVKFDAMDCDAILGLAITYYKMNDLSNSKINFQKAKNIILGTALTNAQGIEMFNNSYWFQKQYYMFSENYSKLTKL